MTIRGPQKPGMVTLDNPRSLSDGDLPMMLHPSTGSTVARRRCGPLLAAVAAGAMALVVSLPADAFVGRSDIILSLNPQDASIGATANGAAVPLQLQEGFISLQTDTPTCVASSSHHCSYVVDIVNIRLNDFPFSGVAVTQPFMVIAGPISLVDSGAGIVIPPGTPALTTGVANETPIFSFQPTPAPITITIDTVAQKAEVMGSFAIDLTVFGQPVHAVGTYLIGAKRLVSPCSC